jgi:hypothetical protein
MVLPSVQDIRRVIGGISAAAWSARRVTELGAGGVNCVFCMHFVDVGCYSGIVRVVRGDCAPLLMS